MAILRAGGLSKRFGDQAVLNDISIALEEASLTALMGRSGSGKTTLLRALAFIEPPNFGHIEFAGTTYSYPRPEPVRGVWPDITVVFQDLFLWPHLDCWENIRLPAVSRFGARGEEAALEIVATLKIEPFLQSYPNEVSRGQRQLIALARALSVSPKVLLLDEITASLDVETSARVAALLRRQKLRGTAIMLITHQFGYARDQADRFAYLDGGQIAEQGPSSILDNPRSEVLQNFVRLSRVAP